MNTDRLARNFRQGLHSEISRGITLHKNDVVVDAIVTYVDGMLEIAKAELREEFNNLIQEK